MLALGELRLRVLPPGDLRHQLANARIVQPFGTLTPGIEWNPAGRQGEHVRGAELGIRLSPDVHLIRIGRQWNAHGGDLLDPLRPQSMLRHQGDHTVELAVQETAAGVRLEINTLNLPELPQPRGRQLRFPTLPTYVEGKGSRPIESCRRTAESRLSEESRRHRALTQSP